MMLAEDLFSEDYSSSAGFSVINAGVIELYNLSRTAYDQSDKERISTFRIDQDKYGRILSFTKDDSSYVYKYGEDNVAIMIAHNNTGSKSIVGVGPIE